MRLIQHFTFYLFFIAATCSLSCSRDSINKMDINSVKNFNDELYRDILTLKVTNHAIGKINSFAFIDSTTFVTCSSNPASVKIFDLDGKLIRNLGQEGKGPFEYLSPIAVRHYNSKIYVWCDQVSKLLTFDIEGNPVSESLDFRHSIKTFELFNNFIAYYHSSSKEQIVSIFDIASNKVKGTLIKPADEHILLSISSPSGGMTIMNDTLYMATADNLAVYSADMENFNLKSFEIADTDFEVENLAVSVEDLINSNKWQLIQYHLKNSKVVGLYNSNDKLVLIAETGEYIQKPNKFDFSNRMINYYLIDPIENTAQKFISPFTNGYEIDYHPVYTTYKKGLYVIRLQENDNDYDLILSKILF